MENKSWAGRLGHRVCMSASKAPVPVKAVGGITILLSGGSLGLGTFVGIALGIGWLLTHIHLHLPHWLLQTLIFGSECLGAFVVICLLLGVFSVGHELFSQILKGCRKRHNIIEYTRPDGKKEYSAVAPR